MATARLGERPIRAAETNGRSAAGTNGRPAVEANGRSAAGANGRPAVEANGHAADQDMHVAFDAWYRAYRDRLRAYCMRILGDAGAAEDVVQETLARAWARRDRFEVDRDIAPWLWRVARNLSIETIRGRSRMVPSETLPDTPDASADPCAPLEDEEERRAVRTALAGMSDRHRELLVLRDVRGVTYDELASQMGVSLEGVRQVLFRARRGLRERVRSITEGAAGVLLWVRLRFEHGGRRAAEAAGAFQPAGQSVLQATLGIAAATALAFGGATATATAQPAAVPVGVTSEAPAVSAPVPATGADAADPGPASRAPARIVGGSVDREAGEVRVAGSVPNPVTGEDDRYWVRVWRENAGDGEGGSRVLSTADEAIETGCGAAPLGCDTADDAMRRTLEEGD